MVFFVFILFILNTVLAQSNISGNQRGYIENRFWYYPQNQSTIASYKNTVRWRPTLSIEKEPSNGGYQLQWTITGNVLLQQGRDVILDTLDILEPHILEQIPPDFNGQKPSFDDVLLDCNWTFYGENEIEHIGDVLTFPRLFMDINTEKLDIRIGKQSINWGSSLFFNPTDILFQYLIAEPWQERQGLEGVRLQFGGKNWLLTTIATVDLPYGLEDINSNNKNSQELPWYTGLRWTQNRKRNKVSMILGANHDLTLAGIDIKGDFTSRDIGYWIEGSWKYEHAFEPHDSFFQYSIGFDNSFDIGQGVRIALQLSHDGSGEEPLFYDWSSRRDFPIELQDCEMYHVRIPQSSSQKRVLLGRWYGLGLLEFRFHHNWRLQTSLFTNLIDLSALAFPALIYEQAHFLFFTGVQSRFGREGEFMPPFSQRNIMGVDLQMLYPSTQFLMWIRWNY